MIIDDIQQRFVSYQTDNLRNDLRNEQNDIQSTNNADDNSIPRLKNKLLTDIHGKIFDKLIY
jgi:hypothetical protein